MLWQVERPAFDRGAVRSSTKTQVALRAICFVLWPLSWLFAHVVLVPLLRIADRRRPPGAREQAVGPLAESARARATPLHLEHVDEVRRALRQTAPDAFEVLSSTVVTASGSPWKGYRMECALTTTLVWETTWPDSVDGWRRLGEGLEHQGWDPGCRGAHFADVERFLAPDRLPSEHVWPRVYQIARRGSVPETTLHLTWLSRALSRRGRRRALFPHDGGGSLWRIGGQWMTPRLPLRHIGAAPGQVRLAMAVRTPYVSATSFDGRWSVTDLTTQVRR